MDFRSLVTDKLLVLGYIGSKEAVCRITQAVKQASGAFSYPAVAVRSGVN
jgi:hypothetical protein